MRSCEVFRHSKALAAGMADGAAGLPEVAAPQGDGGAPEAALCLCVCPSVCVCAGPRPVLSVTNKKHDSSGVCSSQGSVRRLIGFYRLSGTCGRAKLSVSLRHSPWESPMVRQACRRWQRRKAMEELQRQLWVSVRVCVCPFVCVCVRWSSAGSLRYE
jgi:hypothetical protein